METLEKSIVEQCGQGTLDKWKETEAEWKRKVVDINQHNGLVSPYEAAVATGASLLSLIWALLTMSKV